MPNEAKVINKEEETIWKIFMNFGIYMKFCTDAHTSIYVTEEQFAVAYLIQEVDEIKKILKEV